MRFDISYRMRFDYREAVWESQNEVRVRPRDDDRQRVLSYRLTPDPPGRVLSYHDYWGTNVDQVGVRHRHDSFEIVAEAAVETFESTTLVPSEDPSSADSEYLEPTGHTAWDGRIATLAASEVDSIDGRREQIEAVAGLVHRSLTYETGSTEIGISLPELVEGGKGVCQDFAHLTIGMLRSLGIPARYVSGYLFAADETDLTTTSNATVAVQTHAWVEAMTDGRAWLPVDPTNQSPVTERHVVIGHGRDYDDVPPVRGVFTGSTTPVVDAQVTIARLAPLVRTVTSDRRRPERPRRSDISAQQQ